MVRRESSSAAVIEEDVEDIRLMERVGAGEVAAFEQIVERHQRLVTGTVARMLGSNSEVEDIAQQVFIRVWKSANRYVPRARFTTWLLKITRNLVFNELRRRSRHAQLSPREESPDEERPIQDDHTLAPDASLLAEELQDAINAAIARLPETQRMAVILRRYHDLSYEQIAEVLDHSVPAIKSLLFRARTELRADLNRYLAG